jgi:hypothetical protein
MVEPRTNQTLQGRPKRTASVSAPTRTHLEVSEPSQNATCYEKPKWATSRSQCPHSLPMGTADFRSNLAEDMGTGLASRFARRLLCPVSDGPCEPPSIAVGMPTLLMGMSPPSGRAGFPQVPRRTAVGAAAPPLLLTPRLIRPRRPTAKPAIVGPRTGLPSPKSKQALKHNGMR